MFKELEQKFHHTNLYTISHIVIVLNYSPKLYVTRAPSEVHYVWDAYLEMLYKRPGTCTVDEIYIFRAEVNEAAHLTIEAIKGIDIQVQNLHKVKIAPLGATKAGRTRILTYSKVQLIKPKELKPIK